MSPWRPNVTACFDLFLRVSCCTVQDIEWTFPFTSTLTTTTTSTTVGSIPCCSVSFHGAVHFAIRAVHLHNSVRFLLSPAPSVPYIHRKIITSPPTWFSFPLAPLCELDYIRVPLYLIRVYCRGLYTGRSLCATWVGALFSYCCSSLLLFVRLPSLYIANPALLAITFTHCQLFKCAWLYIPRRSSIIHLIKTN
jgi:hypothetical protein